MLATALKVRSEKLDFPCEPLVGIIVLNYNCADYTKECVQSLLNLNYRNFFIVVVDNNSQDGSGFQLKQTLESDQVLVVLNPENRGFAAGNNFGIRLAKEYEAEYFWLINADATADPQALKELITLAQRHSEGGAFGSKILYSKQKALQLADCEQQKGDIVWSAGATVDFTRHVVNMVGLKEVDRGQFDSVRECDYIPGCSFLIKKDVLENVGYMPEDYFLYFEETDWCTRIKRCGYKLYFTPKSLVWHNFDDKKMQSALQVYYYNRNRLLFWFRHSSFLEKAKLILETAFRRLPRAHWAVQAAETSSARALCRAHRAGYTDFLMNRLGKRQI